MKGSTIALAAIGVFNLGLSGLKYAANKHAKARAVVQAAEKRLQDADIRYHDALDRSALYKEVIAREKKDAEHMIRDWKAANEFDIRKAEILDSVNAGIEEFKSSIGYSDKLSEIDDAFDAALDAFKNSVSYDDTKRIQEDLINEAKKHYESQKAAFDLAGDDISDTTMKLRHAAEEAMNTKVKEAKAKIDALDKQLKDETEKLTQKKLADIRVIEEKVSKERIRLDKKSDKDLEKLNAELSSAQNDIQAKIKKARTNNEFDAVLNHENDIRTIREQHEMDTRIANDIFDTTPMEVRFAEFFKEKKIPKIVVGLVSLLPCIPVGYLAWKYFGFVGSVMKAI